MMKKDFIKGVERLVNPVDVGTIHFIQYFNNFVPKNIQKKMIDKSGELTPHMGFVVEPYSYFLCYEIADLEKAKSFLPDGFDLVKTSVFENGEKKYYGIIGCFNAHTSGFWGMRVEFYIIAEDRKTGLMSWIIVDYDTNTITYDPQNGLSDPNATGSLLTVDYSGTLYVDVQNDNGRQLIFNSDITSGQMENLDQRLWVEGNLSIAYGRNKSIDDPGLFSLTFDPKEFEKGIRISKDSFNLQVNNWYPGLFKPEPQELVCFPYAQHFLSDSPGHNSELKSEEDLIEAVDQVDFDDIKIFSTKKFKKTFLSGGALSIAINVLLLTFILIS